MTIPLFNSIESKLTKNVLLTYISFFPTLAIVVVRDGVVSEVGTHEDLLADPKSYYSHMWAERQNELPI